MRINRIAPAICILLAQSALAADAGLQVIYNFNSPGSAGTPNYIVEVSPGTFMGTAGNGASVFSVTSGGVYQNIYVFPSEPSGIGTFGLTPALNGQVYGSADQAGTAPTFSELYSISTAGSFTAYPYNASTQGGAFSLVQNPDNHLYSLFGIEGGPSSFARLDYNGIPLTLHKFDASEGLPFLIFPGYDDAFYGLSFFGENGTTAGIFRLTVDGTFSWVVPSISNTSYTSALIEATNGKFYGTLSEAGTAGAGLVYEATLGGQMRTIYEFPQRTTGAPSTLMQASDGMLYGTTIGNDVHLQNNAVSTIFRLDPSNGNFETLYKFAGRDCACQLVQGSDGRIYGISYYQNSYGTFFVLDLGLAPPMPFIKTFGPESGGVGQVVLLWGHDLLGTTGVSFNGTPAETFSVPTGEGVWATVPAGATTGPVSITTPNGTYVTGQNFTVN